MEEKELERDDGNDLPPLPPGPPPSSLPQPSPPGSTSFFQQNNQVELKTEGYWDELDRRQPNCLTKTRPTAPPITGEHFPFRRRQRCHVSSVVPVIR
ncbi:hypothetical protein J6590_013189 [Homalodisca vitripennis]|nr:hypothetical protein J6590_013189 [Homalodisca vitripennis]